MTLEDTGRKDLEPAESPIPPPITEAEMSFYYHGFLSALRRYRALALIGWAAVAAGFLFLMLDWRAEATHGLLDIALSVLTMTAGVGLVQAGVASLDAYVRIPARELQGKRGEVPPAPLGEILELMGEVATGGWQEAFAAIRRLRAIGRSSGFPDAG